MVSLPNILFSIVEEGDGMTDNYYDFNVFAGNTISVDSQRIGYNRDDNLVHLTHLSTFDNGVAVSLHLGDNSTDYQNTTGSTVYVIISMEARTNTGDRAYKIYSAPTTDSVAGATEVFDSATIPTFASWDTSNEKLTSFLVPIQDNHFIVIENTSGSSPRLINLPIEGPGIVALVVEPTST